MVTSDYQSESGVRDETVSAGASVLRRVVCAYTQWVARREAIRQLNRLDGATQKDLAIDSSEFNSIVFGGAAGRRRPHAKR